MLGLPAVILPGVLALRSVESRGVPAGTVARQHSRQHTHQLLGVDGQDQATIGARLKQRTRLLALGGPQQD